MMQVQGVRGAITVEENSRDAILAATKKLLEVMVEKNGITPSQVGSILFSCTADLNAAFPAEAARQPGWEQVPLFCCQEIPVAGSLGQCIRVLIHWNTAVQQKAVQHIYLEKASQLRPDLTRRDAQ